MYFAHFLLFVSCLCAINATVYDKSNQAITSIVAYTPPGNAVDIRFQQNFISHVPAGYFVNLPSLNRILLNLNAITSIDDQAFTGTPSVTHIFLDNNQLTIIYELTFAGLPNLEMLSLSFNQIHTIETASFHGNTALTTLDLRDNFLETLTQQIFDASNHPTALNQLKINDNLLQCTQAICWIKQACNIASVNMS